MAKEKLVKNITSRDEDFAQWYTDVVKKAELYGIVCCDKIIERYNAGDFIMAILKPKEMAERHSQNLAT